jgi:NDP-sugar pyrophosphorylase family protein
LVPLGERPILEWIFLWLARSGVERVEVCIGHLGQLIQTYFSQPETIPPGLEVQWHWEHEPLGTAGALRFLCDLDETLLVINGDVLSDLDLQAMLDFHHAQDAALTIATRDVELRTDLGVIEHKGGRVTSYHEKPAFHHDASMGVYLYEPRALTSLPDGACQFPDFVVTLLSRGEHVAAFRTDASWHHVGTLSEHIDATRALSEQGASGRHEATGLM